ncbi:MAG TPA: YqjK-like family protein [Gallionella sp.]|nr:YqjK-like family protein [Gallionella sp.]
MNEQMLTVMQRRGELLTRIAAQREQVAQIGARWQAPLALADQGLAVVRFLRFRPVLVAGVVALFIIRRRGAMGLARGVWLAWKGYRYLTALPEKLSSRN